jgi:hypothetical protein
MKTLTVINENKIVIDGKTYVYLTDESPKTEPKPEFKVGDWVCLKTTSYPYRINRVLPEGNLCLDNLQTIGGRLVGITPGGMRLATPQEVESYLKGICDEKYIGKTIINLYRGNKVKVLDKYPTYIGQYDDFYILGEDTEGEHCNALLYSKGIFAEVLPQEFKELPKTIEELILLIQNFERDGKGWLTPYGFLKEQGYKVD